jgi:hypothetical protein
VAGTSRIHDILPRVAVALAPVLLGLFALGIWGMSQFLRMPEDADVFEIAAGTWGWVDGPNTCKANPHTISFASDRQSMTYEDGSGTYVYDIVEHEMGRIRGAIRGEDRMTDAGVPVVWDLLLRGPNMYVWHRTDWPALMTEGPVVRCGTPWRAPSDSDSVTVDSA